MFFKYFEEEAGRRFIQRGDASFSGATLHSAGRRFIQQGNDETE